MLRGLLVLAVGALAVLKLLPRYEVEGDSMLPSYRPGDRIVLKPLHYRFRQPKIGEAVVLRRARAGGRVDIKRLSAGPGDSVEVAGQPYVLGTDEWFVLGDNASESTDSRTRGPVKRSELVGAVWFRY